MRIEPLTAAIGAEILDIDLANLSTGEFDSVHKALLDHKVVFFRNQHISTEDHIAFGRRFGELEVHPFALDDGGHPEIVVIESNEKRQYAAERWHSDVTWRQEPSMGSILRGCIIPKAGGDTCFANAEAAYDRLSDRWKERVEGLTASHDYLQVFGDRVPDDEKDEMRAKYPVAHHPVIRTHPETGARGIYTNRSFVTHVDDVEPEESTAILDRLERAISSPNVQCRFRWQVDSFAFWDNRATQHFATSDFFPETRRVERVTIAGDRPY